MAFRKGHAPWNKGLTKDTDIRVASYAKDLEGRACPQERRDRISKNPNIAWCKGLTNETDERVRRRSQSVSVALTGKRLSEAHRTSLKGRTGTKPGWWTAERRDMRSAKLRQVFSSPEVRKHRSEVMLALWQQDWYRNKVTTAVVAASHKRPSGLEQRVLSAITKFNFPYLYTGDGSYVLAGANPDFIHWDETKVIEVWGEHWHTGRWLRETPEERIARFEVCGVRTLVLFGEAISVYSDEKLASLLESFSRTGVSSIVRTDAIEQVPFTELSEEAQRSLIRRQCKRLWKPLLSKEALEHLYLTLGYTTSKIASQIGCTPTTVANWLRRYGVPLRKPDEFLKGRRVTWGEKIREGHLKRGIIQGE